MMTRRHGHNFGFTLVEVLTAVVILSVGVLGIYRGMLKVLQYQDFMAYHLTAQEIFQNYATEVIGNSKKFSGEGFQEQDIYRDTINNRSVQFAVYAQGEPDEIVSGLVRVSVVVAWTSHGRHNQIDRSFYIFRDLLVEDV